MKIIRILIVIGIACLGIILFSGCKSKDKTNPTILTGEKKEVLTQTISSSGGEIVVDKPGDPLDKLAISIPENAYDDSRHFHVSYETITDHKLGEFFNPVTPLISITNGGGYSNVPMVLTIPVNLPEGQSAMAFLYDPHTGKLEGLPLLESDRNKVVVMTRWFGMQEQKRGGALDHAGTQAAEYLDEDEAARIVLTAIQRQDIAGVNDTTGFHPGIDDFSVSNWGSSVTKVGFCEGQSLAMMWYYINKRSKGEPSLYTLLDNDGDEPTPKYWQDDALTIKLVSTVQTDKTITAPVRFFIKGAEVIAGYTVPDKITYDAFRLAMKLTGEPQLVGLNTTNSTLGHMVVLYKIKEGDLYVADPNFPGDSSRKITFDPAIGKFLPYQSGTTAAEKDSKEYNIIGYYGKSSAYGWPTIKTHWEEVLNKTIGNDKFPSFQLVALNDQVEFVPFEDGFEVPQGRLKIMMRGIKDANLQVFDAKGNLLRSEDDGTVQLPAGKQKINVQLLDNANNWLGFKKVSVNAVGEIAPVESTKAPIWGDLSVQMRVDGQNETIDAAKFAIETAGGSFGMTGYGPRPAGDENDWNRLEIKIDTEGWIGQGIYNNVTFVWRDKARDGATYADRGKGYMVITNWSPEKLEGTFSFTATEENVLMRDPKIRKVEGSFRYTGRSD